MSDSFPKPAAKPLPELYHEWIATCIDDKGVENYGIAVEADGNMTMLALVVTPPEAYAVMLTHWARRRPVEMIFALDRFARSGQGTSLDDLLAGHHFVGEQHRPFTIEYRHEPRLVKPIDWDNQFWNDALNRELAGSIRQVQR